MANPYSGGGSATTGGGQGNWSDSTVAINGYALPINNTANGFVTTYLLNDAQLKTFRDFVWSVWGSISNYFTSIYDAVVATFMLPISPTELSGDSMLMYIGVTTVNDSAVVPNQFLIKDFGTVTVDKYSDSFLDYNTYTQVSLYLPYIGTVDLDTNMVMGKAINIKYVIDVYTGNLVAQIYVDGSLTYQYAGNCAYQIPFTSIDFSNTITSTIKTASIIASMIA